MEMHLLGIHEVEAAFDRVLKDVEQANRDIVAESAALVENAIKQNFSGSHAKGEPHTGGDKPNVVTGTLRRGVRHQPIVRDGVAGAMTVLGPTSVYARRVEIGFSGADSRGRRYHQPGYPYFGPGVDSTREAVQEIARRRWSRAITGG